MAQEDAVRDYLIGSGYRKFDSDALDVPAFHASPAAPANGPSYGLNAFSVRDEHCREARPREMAAGSAILLSTSLPERIGSFEALLSGDAPGADLDLMQALSVLLTYACRPMRFEPFNTYVIHRGIASPRCLFACSVILAFRDPSSGRRRLLRYIPDDHLLLEVTPHGDVPDAMGAADCVVALVGDLAAPAKPYGEFSPSLVAPESGLVCSQLQILCQALGWPVKARTILDRQAVTQSMGLREGRDLPLFLLDLPDNCADLLAQPMSQVEVWEPSGYPERLGEGAVPQLMNATDEDDGAVRSRLNARATALRPQTAPRRLADDVGGGDQDVLEVLRDRNSASYPIGLAPRGERFRKADLTGIMDDWVRLNRLQSDTDLWAVNVDVFLSVLRFNEGVSGRYKFDVSNETFELVDPSDPTPAFERASTMPLANLREFNLVATFCCDFASELSVIGSRTFFLAHQKTGWLAHSFSLAVARRGMFARPVRMYDDGVLEAALDLSSQPTLQVLSGFNRSARLTFDLG